MTVIVNTAIIIGLAVLSLRPNASFSGMRNLSNTLFLNTYNKKYATVPITSVNTKVK